MKGGQAMLKDFWTIQQIKRRKESGIRAVIDQYGGLLMAVIKRHALGYEAYHEECFNDTLLAIWDNISAYDAKKSSFKNWICAIARYKALNLVCDNRRIAQQESYDDHYESGDRQILDQLILREDLEHLISSLSEEDQAIFLALFYEGQDVKEVAQAHQLSPNALYQRIHRGREKLKGERKHEQE